MLQRSFSHVSVIFLAPRGSNSDTGTSWLSLGWVLADRLDIPQGNPARLVPDLGET